VTGEDNMPIYEFLCHDCGLRFEVLYPRISDEQEHICECGGTGKRQVSAVSFKFNHSAGQRNGPLPPNTGTSDDWNYDKAIGRDAAEKWEKIEENKSKKERMIREQRKAGIGVSSQHLVKTRDQEGYRVMSESERKTINERRKMARVVNKANVENNKQARAKKSKE